jgi:hypothetical protein
MKSNGKDRSKPSTNRRMLNPQVTPDFLDSALAWFFINDLVKLGAYRILDRNQTVFSIPR